MSPEYHCCIGGRNGTANAATSACPATRRQNRKRRNQSTLACIEGRDVPTVASQRAIREPLPSSQPSTVQAAILDCLAHMFRGQVCELLQIGDGAGDLENTVVRPGGERQPGDRGAQERIGTIGYAAERADVSRRHVRVGIDARAAREPVPLHRASPVYPLTHRLARLAPALIGERAVL